jgi:Domain of unknown function (DUF1906)/Fibronectin type III domain
VIRMRPFGRAGLVCALPVLALLVPQAAFATTSPAGPAQPAAAAATGTRNVSYDGVRLSVPAAWPVIDLRLHPSACVRLDRSALYLGSPGAQSSCPAHAVGRADTIWLKPAASGLLGRPATPSTSTSTSASQVATVGTLSARVGVDPVSHDKQAQFVAAGVELDATWGASSSSVDRVLASAVASPSPAPPATPASRPPLAAPTKPGAARPGTTASAAPQAVAPAALTPAIAAESTFTGMAFDACSAPSSATMGSWLSSPYRSAGVYIGGSMRACGDGNLSAAWVSAVHAMGWGLIPIYVGPQAPCVNQGGLATISPSSARAQGIANAADAVLRARYFGMGAGTPIYYDMESYSPSGSCSATVASFVSGWTAELHALSYRSGTYGSPGSLMTDLSRYVGTAGFSAPDDVWFAHWNELQNTSDQASYPGFPNANWSAHQRLHQYAGGATETWGGQSLNIDSNWVDGAVAGTAAPVNYGTTVVGPGGSGFTLAGSMSYWRFGTPAGLKGLAYWTRFNGATEGNGASWSPRLAAGRYDVEANIPTSSSASARYTISASGANTVKLLSQVTRGYRSLGTYTATAGGSISVHLSDIGGAGTTNPQIWADAMSFRLIATAPATAPHAPTTVSGTAANAAAVMSWTAPSNGGAAITKYTVTASPGGRTATTTGATKATVTGLTNGTAYKFTVKATNAVGTSPASLASAVVTPKTVPGAPTGVLATPGNAAAAVSWTAPTSNGGAAITKYTVTASPGGRSATTTGATQAALTGLTNGTAYKFTVTTTNAAGSSPASLASAVVTPKTIPGAPTRVAATPSNTAAVVSWTAPSSNGGSAVTGYTVTASPGGRSATTAGATKATVTGLTNGTAYKFTVTTTNIVGTSTASLASAGVTPRTVPGAPSAVSASAADASAAVSWTAPSSNGGAAITKYTVTASPGGRSATTTGATQATVTGLTNGTAYTFTVSATNVAGTSPASPASTVVTFKFATWAYVASSRSGGAVTINGLIHQWTTAGMTSPAGRVVFLQRYIHGAWQNMVGRTTNSVGRITIGFMQPTVCQYRLIAAETSTAWAGHSASTFR